LNCNKGDRALSLRKRARVFFPTFENSPKIEFFEFCYEIGFELKFKPSSFNIEKEKKILSRLISVRESIEKKKKPLFRQI